MASQQALEQEQAEHNAVSGLFLFKGSHFSWMLADPHYPE
jgi:hypothetical protein